MKLCQLASGQSFSVTCNAETEFEEKHRSQPAHAQRPYDSDTILSNTLRAPPLLPSRSRPRREAYRWHRWPARRKHLPGLVVHGCADHREVLERGGELRELRARLDSCQYRLALAFLRRCHNLYRRCDIPSSSPVSTAWSRPRPPSPPRPLVWRTTTVVLDF